MASDPAQVTESNSTNLVAANDPSSINGLDERSTSGRGPRLSISHFLVWTALTALLMAADSWSDLLYRALPNSRTPPTSAEFMFARTLGAMVDGIGLGALVMVFTRRRRGMAFPREAGEWMLVMRGLVAIVQRVVGILQPVLFGTAVTAGSTLFLAAYAGTGVLKSLIPAIFYRQADRWRLFFKVSLSCSAVWAAVYLLYYLGRGSLGMASMMNWLFPLIGAISTAFVLAAAISDWRHKTPRGWVHWVGVFAVTVYALCQMGWAIYLAVSR